MHSRHWADAVQQCEHKGIAYALVTILGSSGSTPRDPGSKMVVTQTHTYDSIGGGNLEHTIVLKAREKIAENKDSAHILPLPLGGALGQCCGGNTTVLIETFSSNYKHIGLFGAGHVAKALVKILGDLPFNVSWIDSREQMFPGDLAPNIATHRREDPVSVIAELPPGSAVLIMTHDHPLDLALTKAALRQSTSNSTPFCYLGIIGSKTKAERFRYRLSEDGFTPEDIDRISCPVGLDLIPGKRPMEVAVSIAGELIALQHSDIQHPVRKGLAWTQIKAVIHKPQEHENPMNTSQEKYYE